MTDMTYTKMGNSGLIVSRMCFGTMTFNLGAGTSEMSKAVAKVDQSGATEMVARCMDAGVNFFDTANGYSNGDAERALGVALQGRRDAAVISTKLGFRQGPAITNAGLSRRHVLTAVEDSLKRLDIDVIDLLIVHKTDFTTPMDETLAALDTCVQHGKARYIGFSNWPAWQAARAIQFQRDNGLAPFIAGQLLYNLVQRDVEPELVPMMADMGVSLMAWSPLSGGLLSGKYDPDNVKETKDGRLAEFDMLKVDPDAARRGLQALKDVAARHDVSAATVALAWILAQSRQHTFIAGASKMAHADAALAAASLKLSDADLAALTDAAPPRKTYPHSFADSTTDAAHKAALS